MARTNKAIHGRLRLGAKMENLFVVFWVMMSTQKETNTEI